MAAANPIGGHYEKSKTVSANLNISGPLLSRFDLLFILLDTPNKELDARISAHIMDLHAGQQKDHDSSKYLPTLLKTSMNESGLNAVSMPSNENNQNEGDILLAKLRLDPCENFDPIPGPLFRKYIAFARRKCNPRIGDKAADALSEFYTELRQRNLRSNGCNPVTMRQLESLARLTQARAKAELRDECTREDALEVIEIMKSSMVDYYENELGLLDMTTNFSGASNNMTQNVGGGKVAQIKNFLALMQMDAENRKSPIFTVERIKLIYDVRIFKFIFKSIFFMHERIKKNALFI